jgi:hypothetical protein
MLASPCTCRGAAATGIGDAAPPQDPVTAYVVADDDEAAAAIATSTQIVDSAERILEQGALTRF